jgi:Domain of unknown function (DUF397)
MEGWRKSSYSDGNGGNCVETASRNGVVLVRDTKHRDGAVLTIPADAWRRFLAEQLTGHLRARGRVLEV